jgi:hypothetical protein
MIDNVSAAHLLKADSIARRKWVANEDVGPLFQLITYATPCICSKESHVQNNKEKAKISWTRLQQKNARGL